MALFLGGIGDRSQVATGLLVARSLTPWVEVPGTARVRLAVPGPGYCFARCVSLQGARRIWAGVFLVLTTAWRGGGG